MQMLIVLHEIFAQKIQMLKNVKINSLFDFPSLINFSYKHVSIINIFLDCTVCEILNVEGAVGGGE